MSNMSNLDIVLSEYKLSDAQKNAVVELLSGGATVAKAVTFKALKRKGLVTKVDEVWQLDDSFKAELKEAYSQPEAREEESVESLLQGDPWKLGNTITEFDKFDDNWDDLLKVTAGFGATLDWRGTEVWNGLTAAEIREDIETATPVNRKARRTHYRTLRNAFRRLNNNRTPETRKSLKITGRVGV